jgi:iron complex outermembrane receptor protein
VQSYLDANGLENPTGNATLGYRSVLIGGRADEYQTTATPLRHRHRRLGLRLDLQRFADPVADQAQGHGGGRLLRLQHAGSLVAAGKYDPVTGQGADQLKGAAERHRLLAHQVDAEHRARRRPA